MEVELRKIEANGVELEVKLKVQWRWSGVEVKIVEVEWRIKFRILGILVQ
jgi:hypothetical protein